jgi:hypothetical protein
MTSARYRERAGNAARTRPEHFSEPGKGKSRGAAFPAHLCDCGCGHKFTPTREWQRFKNTAHRKAAWKQRHKDHLISEILKRLRAIEKRLGLNKKGG